MTTLASEGSNDGYVSPPYPMELLFTGMHTKADGSNYGGGSEPSSYSLSSGPTPPPPPPTPIADRLPPFDGNYGTVVYAKINAEDGHSEAKVSAEAVESDEIELRPLDHDQFEWVSTGNNVAMADVYIMPPTRDMATELNTMFVTNLEPTEPSSHFSSTDKRYRLLQLLNLDLAVADLLQPPTSMRYDHDALTQVPAQRFVYIVPNCFDVNCDRRDLPWLAERQGCTADVSRYTDAVAAAECTRVATPAITSQRLRAMLLVDALLLEKYTREQYDIFINGRKSVRPCPVPSLDLTTETTDRTIAYQAANKDIVRPMWTKIKCARWRCSRDMLRSEQYRQATRNPTSQQVLAGVLFWYRRGDLEQAKTELGCIAHSSIVASQSYLTRKVATQQTDLDLIRFSCT